MAKLNLRDYIEGSKEKEIKGFLEKEDLFRNDITNIDDGDIYNEFSLQYELGIFLRDCLRPMGYKVQFERNVEFFGGNKKEFIKKEMDIVVFNDDKSEKYAIELKFPPNGCYEKRMHHFVKDIQFMEEVVQSKEKEGLGFTQTYCLTLISDLAKGEKFRTGEGVKGRAAKCFNGANPVEGEFKCKDEKDLIVKGPYHIKWNQIKDTSYHYYLLEI